MKKKWDMSRFPIALIKPALDNVRIYDDFGIANRDDAELTISIREKGIKEPLVLSSDHILVSGHRRLAASKYLNLKTVPVRILDLKFESLPRAERLSVLRTHNQQREKSPGERIRERLVTIDPEHARNTLLIRRISIDIDEFNAQIELEKADAAHLSAYRQVVIEAIGGATNRGAHL